MPFTKRLAAFVVAISLALLVPMSASAATIVRQSASKVTIVSTANTVVFAANPTFTTNEEFCAIVYQSLSATAPSFSGTWTTIDSSTAEATSNYTIACRAVASGDASSTTLTVLSAAIAHVYIVVWEIENFTSVTDDQILGTTETTSPFALTPASSPAGALALASVASYVTGSALGTGKSENLCGGFSTDQNPSQVSSTTIWYVGIAGNNTSPPTSCAMSVTDSGTITTATTYASLVQIGTAPSGGTSHTVPMMGCCRR